MKGKALNLLFRIALKFQVKLNFFVKRVLLSIFTDALAPLKKKTVHIFKVTFSAPFVHLILFTLTCFFLTHDLHKQMTIEQANPGAYRNKIIE